MSVRVREREVGEGDVLRIEKFNPSKNPKIAEIFSKIKVMVNYIVLCDNIPLAYTTDRDISEVRERLENFSRILLEIKNTARKYGYEMFFKSGHNFVRLTKRGEKRVYIPTYYATHLVKGKEEIARLVFENRILFDGEIITRFKELYYTMGDRDYKWILYVISEKSFEDLLKWFEKIKTVG